MGCDSSYMEPHEAEIQSVLMARLISYVRESLKLQPLVWVQRIEIKIYGDISQNDKLASILCGLCNSFTEDEENSILYNGRIPLSRQLAKWWERHQEADAERIKNEH